MQEEKKRAREGISREEETELIGVRRDDQTGNRTKQYSDLQRRGYVMGWLVCIRGIQKGKSYELLDSGNYIFKGENQSLRIEGTYTDGTSCIWIGIRKEEKKEGHFSICKRGERTHWKLNGTVIDEVSSLKSYDRITWGKIWFLFVALESELFEWGE